VLLSLRRQLRVPLKLEKTMSLDDDYFFDLVVDHLYRLVWYLDSQYGYHSKRSKDCKMSYFGQ
jgi:hypothetical protein